MIKKNLKTIIATSIITLSPIIIGLVLWEKLPEQIATHFNVNNEPDGYSSKAFVVFGLPLIMLGLHIICLLATKADPKKKNFTDKNLRLVMWITPAISLLMSVLTYGYTLNSSIKTGTVIILFMGILFIIIGNYMPKVKQNFSIGIKIPWTLADENNWYRTHRLAGKLWVLGGVVICLTALLENYIILTVITSVMALAPVVYSYAIRDKSSQ